MHRPVPNTATEDNSRRPWFKSSFSGGSCACVETMISSDWVGVRDSKYALTGKPAHQQPVIICSREEWEALCHSAADGHSTPATAEIRLILTEEGAGSILSTREGVRLDFTVDEITAFIAGIQAGEFGFQPAPA